jgi:hypothetical protein
LSTRIRAGSPQPAKACRRAFWTSSAPTRAQPPRGENHGHQDRPAAFVGQPQPAGLSLNQGEVLAGVHLPDLMRLGGAGIIAACGPSGRGLAQAGPGQPALPGAGRGDGMPHPAELDAEQFGPPSGVLPTKVDRRVMDGLRPGRERRRSGPIGGAKRGLIARAGSGDEGPHGAYRDLELVGDPKGGLTLLRSLADDQANGDGDRGWHGAAPARTSSKSNEHHRNTSSHPRQNLMSHFPADLHVA